MSRATAVQALITEWRSQVKELERFAEEIQHAEQARSNLNHIAAQKDLCADELAALLLREGQEPPEVCKTCQGRRWVMRSETRDYGNGLGAGGMWNQPCPDCTGLRGGPPAPPGHAGDIPRIERIPGGLALPDGVWDSIYRVAKEVDVKASKLRAIAETAYHAGFTDCAVIEVKAEKTSAGDAPLEAMPDHCENCRAEMPVTTVHLCHACLPSAPREHAGEAPAHTGDCRRWRLVTGHRRVYQGSHACTCGASSQREEPPT